MKIIIAEDDELIRLVFYLKLTKLGHEVMTFCNGSEAFRFIISNPELDLILTDIMMPYMDGIELARAIKRTGSEVPIVAMTGGSLNYRPEDLSLFQNAFQKEGTVEQMIEQIFA
ncbi:response regulator [Algoriphagus namhaensis]